jgi:hypothetical protein
MSFIPIMPLSYYLERNDYTSLEILNQHNIIVKANSQPKPVEILPVFDFDELPDIDLSIFDELEFND